MEVKPGYKQTAVGIIPEEWLSASLAHVSERISVGLATSVTQHYRHEGVPLVRNLNIKDGYFDGSDMLYVSEEFAAANVGKAAKALDVLTVRTGSNLGLSCVLPTAFDGCQTFTTLITTPKRDILDSAYLCLQMGSFLGKAEIARLEVGGAKGNLNTGNLKNYRLSVPPLLEQRAIAAALGDVDGLLDGLNRLIAKKRDLKQAAMQQLLTGQIRLPGFHGEWALMKLGDLGDYYDGTATSGGDLGYVEIGDVNIETKSYDVAQKEKRSVRGAIHVPSGTLLISTVRPTRGAIAITRSSLHVSSAFCRIRPTNGLLFHLVCQPRFLAYLGENSIGGTYPTCRDETILGYESLVASDPAEQAAIAEVLTDMDAELTALEKRREKTRALKLAMTQELLTGRTRLVAHTEVHG